MSAVQERFNATLSRADDLLVERLRREEAELARADAARADAARAKARDDAEKRRQIASTYDDAFRSFGTTVPEAADDESPAAYRRRLFNRLARKLAADHELASVRADDVSSQPIVFDNFERMLLDAAKAEGERPSIENLPDDGTLISRTRVDDMGEKSINWYGRESFIKQMGREGRRLAAIRNPRDNTIIWGRQLQQAR
jgi:hypothetical protein